MSAESFTVLAILEARDRASEIFARVDESLGRFSGEAKRAAGTARAAGDEIDAGLGKTAAGADALAGADARLGAAQGEFAAGAKKSRAEAESGALSIGKLGKAAGITAIGMGVAGALMVKAAGNFQDSTTHLVTDAGESAKNLKMVQAGILQVSTATGTSAGAITNAMYHIESAGYHGKAGLTMLKVAAEGARVGGADLDTVSKTLVGTMNAYGLSASHSASMMNQLIATVGAGDMKMQDLASSLSSVAPLAAAVHIKFSQVGGAIATMTAQGMSANQATQDLANTIRSLSNPNNVAIAEMNQLGINAQDVSQHLGQRGLTGTIGMLTKAITSRMGASGKVLMSAFTQSTTAGADLQAMLKHMPGQFQHLAREFMSGSVSAKQWRTEMRAQTPVNQHLMKQFASLYEKSHSFNSLLAKGGPAAQTYTAALAKMTGGSTGLNTALMLTGKNQAVFADNAKKVAEAAKKSGSNVDNWSKIQGTFNYKLDSAKTAVENTGIAIGSALLPSATSLLKTVTSIVQPIATWTADHRKLTGVLFGGVAAMAATIAVVAGMRKAYQAVTGTISTVKSALKTLGGLAKLTAGKQAAGAAEAAAADSAAAGESAAAWTAANIAMTAGIVLVVAAVVAAVYLIVTHWKQVSHAVAAVWDWVYSHVTGIIGKIIGWVKSHWVLLVAIVTGPLGLAVAEVIKHWNQIKDFISRVVGDVVGWVKSHWMLLVGIITGPLGLAVAEVVKHWDQIRQDTVRFAGDVLRTVSKLAGDAVHWFVQMFDLLTGVEKSGIGNIVRWFGELPGRILHAVGDLGHLLFSSGQKVIQGLINGVKSMIGSVGNAIGGIASTIKSYLPFSPAKQGPLSGAGDPGNSGRSIAANLARGITSGKGLVASASRALAGSVALGTVGAAHGAYGTGSALAASAVLPAVAPAGRGGVTVQLYVTGNTVMSEGDIALLTDRIGQQLNTVLPSAGHHVRG